MATGLFDPVAPAGKLDDRFLLVAEEVGFGPARRMMEAVFERFSDPDGNFREQFQTTAFDARVFELYLFACFEAAGLEIDRQHRAPDYLLARGNERFAVEATTANPSRGAPPRPAPREGAPLIRYIQEQLPIRLGSPLFSKLSKKYWEQPHVAGLPLVFAVESFATEDSLYFSETSLAAYLFARRPVARRLPNDELLVTYDPILSHEDGSKQIPSGFFEQPEAENVSAVLFSNAGTVAKFGRMAHLSGLTGDVIGHVRAGWRLNPRPDADLPLWFVETVGEREESWTEELVLLHNPHARYPLPDEILRGATHYRVLGDAIQGEGPAWHVFASRTVTLVPSSERGERQS